MKDWNYTDENGVSRVMPASEVKKRIESYLLDEEAQNSGYKSNPFIGMKILGGEDCDELSLGEGEFGRDELNPIPVNGTFGQMVYLSSLRTNTGSRLLFQRTGSTGNQLGMIDVFEVLSFDGLVRELLYLDLYHPRKSRKAPKGYKIQPGASLITGIHVSVEGFPNNYRSMVYGNYEGNFIQNAFEDPDVIEKVVNNLV